MTQPTAKLDAGARAIYTVVVNGRPGFDRLSAELQAKFREMAHACFDAGVRFEDHYP